MGTRGEGVWLQARINDIDRQSNQLQDCCNWFVVCRCVSHTASTRISGAIHGRALRTPRLPLFSTAQGDVVLSLIEAVDGLGLGVVIAIAFATRARKTPMLESERALQAV